MVEITVEFYAGQVVPFPGAPDGTAQVDGLLRRNVELLYLRDGRICRKRISAARVAEWCRRTPLLPGLPDNPLRRGCLKRRKRFTATEVTGV